jgi:nitrite reductase/ring-hydroxylating ferredoxin subunit
MFTGVSTIPVAPPGSIHAVNGIINLDIGKIPEMETQGGSIKFEVMQTPVTPLKLQVSRLNDGKILAYRNHCAHGGRELEYLTKKNIIRCVSMGHSKYNLEGQPIGGAAPGPITVYESSLKGTTLKIRIA